MWWRESIQEPTLEECPAHFTTGQPYEDGNKCAALAKYGRQLFRDDRRLRELASGIVDERTYRMDGEIIRDLRASLYDLIRRRDDFFRVALVREEHLRSTIKQLTIAAQVPGSANYFTERIRALEQEVEGCRNQLRKQQAEKDVLEDRIQQRAKLDLEAERKLQALRLDGVHKELDAQKQEVVKLKETLEKVENALRAERRKNATVTEALNRKSLSHAELELAYGRLQRTLRKLESEKAELGLDRESDRALANDAMITLKSEVIRVQETLAKERLLKFNELHQEFVGNGFRRKDSLMVNMRKEQWDVVSPGSTSPPLEVEGPSPTPKARFGLGQVREVFSRVLSTPSLPRPQVSEAPPISIVGPHISASDEKKTPLLGRVEHVITVENENCGMSSGRQDGGELQQEGDGDGDFKDFVDAPEDQETIILFDDIEDSLLSSTSMSSTQEEERA